MTVTPGQAIINLRHADAGSVALDADVYEALGHRVIRSPRESGMKIGWKYMDGRTGRWVSLEPVTTEVNAALKITPHDEHGRIGVTVTLELFPRRQDRRRRGVASLHFYDGTRTMNVHGDDAMARAFCIAALEELRRAAKGGPE